MATQQLRTMVGCVRPALLAKRLGVDPSTLDAWRKQRGLPSFKIGGFRFYRLSSVDAWLRKQEAAK